MGALEEVFADAVGDCFSLRDEFGGIELGNDGFEDFVANGGEDSLVVVLAEILDRVSNVIGDDMYRNQRRNIRT